MRGSSPSSTRTIAVRAYLGSDVLARSRAEGSVDLQQVDYAKTAS